MTAMPLGTIAVRSLGAETGESIIWMARRDSGEIARVFQKRPTDSGRERPPRVQYYPEGALPPDMLRDLLEKDERDGFVNVPYDSRRAVKALSIADMLQPNEEEFCIPVTVQFDGDRMPPFVRDWSRTLIKRRAARIKDGEHVTAFLWKIQEGQCPSTLLVSPGSPLVPILAFLQEKVMGTSAEFHLERGSYREPLPSSSDPVFGVWGLHREMAEDWSNPIRSKAII